MVDASVNDKSIEKGEELTETNRNWGVYFEIGFE